MDLFKTNSPIPLGERSLQPPIAAPETGVVFGDSDGASSGDKAADSPDPRWPYLNRWSKDNSSLAEQIEIHRSAKKPPAPVESVQNSPPDSNTLDWSGDDSFLAARIGEIERSATKPSPVRLEIPPPTTDSIPVAVFDPPTSCLVEEAAIGTQPESNPEPAVSPETAPPPSIEAVKNPLPVIDSVKTSAAVLAPPLNSKTSEEAATGSQPQSNTELAVASDLRSVNQDAASEALNCNKLSLTSDATLAHKPAPPTSPHSRLGAWAKPLLPSLAKGIETRKSSKQETNAVHTSLTKEDDVRFPWAARMDPASRNLYRATEPEYLEDGTPKVTIPQHVLSQGIENQKEFIVGQFYRCTPPPAGLIFAVLNNLWGRKCKIIIRKLSESSYLFHIPDQTTRDWVLQRSLWHVDDCLLFVAPWTPDATLAIPEIKTLPVWVTLKKIPNILYSIPGISHIASGLGAPMATYKPILDPVHMGEAKILVEVELSKAFPPKIAASDTTGFISMVDVEYAWLPTKCNRCGELGHKVRRCLKPASEDSNVPSLFAPSIDPPLTHQSPASARATSLEVAPPKVSVTSSPVPNVEKVSTPFTLSFSEEADATISPPTEAIPHTESVFTDSPPSETAPLVLSTSSPRTQASTHREGKQHVTGLGPNQFASLASSGGDEVSSDSDAEPESMDLLTPPGKRILRDRPVKPTVKATENTWQKKGRGRGGRGRG